MTTENYDQIIYRKQFFFGPQKLEYPGWKSLQMPWGNWLSTHPTLTVTQAKGNGIEVTLIGFILNPDSPADSDQAILESLIGSAHSVDELIEATEPYGGRWAMIVSGGGSFVIFNDPAGTRTVFHHFDDAGRPWLASQPGLLADVFGFTESEESKEFRASPEFQKRTEIWWPGDATPFKEIRILLPNHYLNLRTREVKRFWPNKPLAAVPLNEGAQQAAAILKGVLAAAHTRFPMALSLSSGLDSRAIFAACRDFADEVFIFSMKYRHLNDESDDIRIPREMTQSLMLEHHVFDCAPYQSEAFKQVFDKNVQGLKTDWANIAECRDANLPEDVVVLKGSISEIMRCRYWSLGVYPRKVDLDYIVKLMGYVGGNTSLVTDSLGAWLPDAQVVENYGYKLLDFLSWEIEVGKWYALGCTVFDIAREDFTPFVNRKFYNIMLGIDPKYRSYPMHVAQRELVNILWPELSKFPYTPSRVLPKKKFTDGAFFDMLRSVKKKAGF